MSDDLSAISDIFRSWVEHQLFENDENGFLYFLDFYYRLSNDYLWCERLFNLYCQECLNQSLKDDERAEIKSALYHSGKNTNRIRITNQKLEAILKIIHPFYAN